MAEVNLNINGKNYAIACDDGQERRVADLGRYIDHKVRDIAKSGAGSNENQLLVLTALMMADEMAELREYAAAQQHQARRAAVQSEDEAQIVEVIDELAERIDAIAGRLKAAA